MKLLRKFAILSITCILSLLVLLQFPELFIDEKLNYRVFNIYSNEAVPMTDDVKFVLDSVITNLERSQFYQKDQIFKLFFVHDSFYEKLTRLFGVNHIASSKYNRHLYYGTPHFKEGKLIKGPNKNEWVNLVQIVSHEAVHSQMYKDYSTLGFMKTPSWINEGYCEYISYSPMRMKNDYDLSNLLIKYLETDDTWMATEYTSMTPRRYVRDRIIMEYLIDKKGLDIRNIIENKNLTPDALMKEISVPLSE